MKNNNITAGSTEIDFLEGYYPQEPLTYTEEAEMEKSLDEKIRKNKKSIFRIIGHLKALKRYMLSKDVKWYRKSVVIAAILYFISPLDAMPDIAPLIGFLDDFGVIAWTIRFLGREITDYYE
jgi:uncharacterized membrane protein YkvA (DUF1232 family)